MDSVQSGVGPVAEETESKVSVTILLAGELPKTVGPLRKLLMDTPADVLLTYLHRTALQWTLVRRKDGSYHALIFKEGVEHFRASNLYSPKAALCDALARFLTATQARDYHMFTVRERRTDGK